MKELLARVDQMFYGPPRPQPLYGVVVPPIQPEYGVIMPFPPVVNQYLFLAPYLLILLIVVPVIGLILYLRRRMKKNASRNHKNRKT